MAGRFKVLTFNCRGLGTPLKRRRVTAALLRERPDVVFLQETHIKSLDPASPYVLKSKWFPHQHAAFGSSKARGVVILIAKNLQFTFSNSLADPRGRYLFVNCVIDGIPLTLASVYAPNVDQLPFLTDTLLKLNMFKSGEVILGGDLNHVSDLAADKHAVIPSKSHRHRGIYRPKRLSAPTKLPDLLNSFGLVDVWRTLYPSSRQFTYFSPVHHTYTRIDFILVSHSMIGTVFSADVGLRSLSDHAWVSCLLSRKISDGKGPDWALNTSLLKDPVICGQIEEEIKNYFLINTNCGVSRGTVWDAFKAVVRGSFISAAASCKKAKQHILTDLTSKIAFLEARHRRYGGLKLSANWSLNAKS